LINNAAQTIERPSCFYEHLLTSNNFENKDDNNIKKIYGDFCCNKRIMHPDSDQGPNNNIVNINNIGNIDNIDNIDYSVEGIRELYFPRNQFDEHHQQIDLRPKNNWIKTIQEIKPEECAELFTINAIAPFHLIGELFDLMKRTDNIKHSWIINVSSMEGSFNRKNKTHYHPHNNMAKASLNMITRTNANKYFKDYIVMLSVDTGWNTVEEPCSYHLKSPIDCIDGMARILDPIFNNLTTPGLFYKNFRPTAW
jgi:NAD(P)-dependent dehydrogenase (short-subunit alcohol dehydrogenase family)